MKKLDSYIIKGVSLLLVVAVLVTFFGQGLYAHKHTLNDGSVISHSHAYHLLSQVADDAGATHEHSHTTSQLRILNLIMITGALVVMAYFFAAILNLIKKRERFLFTSQLNSVEIYAHSQGRAPPVSLLFNHL